MMSTNQRIILIDTNWHNSVQIRTASDLRSMLAEICENSGPEIAYECEAIAKKAADVWRKVEEIMSSSSTESEE